MSVEEKKDEHEEAVIDENSQMLRNNRSMSTNSKSWGKPRAMSLRQRVLNPFKRNRAPEKSHLSIESTESAKSFQTAEIPSSLSENKVKQQLTEKDKEIDELKALVLELKSQLKEQESVNLAMTELRTKYEATEDAKEDLLISNTKIKKCAGLLAAVNAFMLVFYTISKRK